MGEFDLRLKDVGVSISRLLRIFPYSISSTPYDFALKVVQAYFKDLDVEIWSRNGHVLRTLTPGASDLDLTVMARKNDEVTFNSFMNRYNRLKVFLPFLGEINWVFEDSLEFFGSYLNPMEGNRDPLLLERISTNFSCSEAQKVCFFLRCLASDTYGIRTNFLSRKRKWDRHLQDLGFYEYKDKLKTPAEIFELCEENLLVKNLPHYQSGFLGKLIQNYHQDINAWNRFYQVSNVRDFIVLAPNRWLGATLHFEKLEEDIELIRSFSDFEFSLFQAQIEWEVWGLYTQINQIEDKEGLKKHLNNFMLVIDKLEGMEKSKQGFVRLLAI